MTLKDKKNKREYNRKLKAEGGCGASQSKEKEAGKRRDAARAEKQSSDPGSGGGGVTETAAKLITEANKRFEESEAITV